MTCTVEGCDKPRRSGDLRFCSMHRARMDRHGNLDGKRPSAPPEVRFWRYVTAGPVDECWVWQGNRNNQGYGMLHVGKPTYAHRFSYEMANGPIPPGMFILHSCDNRPCVNPAHLRVGTSLDNMRDMIAKGRGHTGPLKTHCKRGHSYAANGRVGGRGDKNCSECQKVLRAARKAREAS